MYRIINIIISLLLILMIMVGCGKQGSPASNTSPVKTEEVAVKTDGKADDKAKEEEDKNEFDYKVIDEKFKEEGIEINFPQIVSENNPTESDLINDVIQENIKSILSLYSSEEKPSITLDYTMSEYDKKALSIVYKGLYSQKDAAYPTNLFYTLNIYLGKDIRAIPLNELFKIDEFFVSQFKNGMYSPQIEGLDLEESGQNPKEIIESIYTDAQLIEQFKEENAKYYLADQGVILSVEAPHAIGDHIEMAIPYEAIEGNFVKENPVWQDYLFKDEG